MQALPSSAPARMRQTLPKVTAGTARSLRLTATRLLTVVAWCTTQDCCIAAWLIKELKVQGRDLCCTSFSHRKAAWYGGDNLTCFVYTVYPGTSLYITIFLKKVFLG